MIEIKNLCFQVQNDQHEPVEILKNINLRISEGESVALMGPNGSGKTTLARCLNGLHLPASGEVWVDGISTKNEQRIFEIRRKVGIIFQNPENQIVSSTVEREIAFGLENLGIPYEQMVAIIQEMLDKFDLKRYRTHPPHLLSGGEKQRLAVAAVMAMQPQYLILDEPTSLLDPITRDNILQLIRDLHRIKSDEEQGKLTTILITQFPEEALFAERLVVFNAGEILMDGSPIELFRKIEAFKAIGLDVPVEFKIEKILLKKGMTRESVWKLLESF